MPKRNTTIDLGQLQTEFQQSEKNYQNSERLLERAQKARDAARDRRDGAKAALSGATRIVACFSVTPQTWKIKQWHWQMLGIAFIGHPVLEDSWVWPVQDRIRKLGWGQAVISSCTMLLQC